MREVRVESAVEGEGERGVVLGLVLYWATGEPGEQFVDVADTADGAEIVPGAAKVREPWETQKMG